MNQPQPNKNDVLILSKASCVVCKMRSRRIAKGLVMPRVLGALERGWRGVGLVVRKVWGYGWCEEIRGPSAMLRFAQDDKYNVNKHK
jgi:hypothetical protein